MTDHQASTVFFYQFNEDDSAQNTDAEFVSLLNGAIAELNTKSPSDDPASWTVKMPMSTSGHDSAVPIHWLLALSGGLKDSGHSVGSFFDNLSITTVGLETVDGLRNRAKQLEFQTDFVVGDDPQSPGGQVVSLSEECALPTITLSSAATQAEGLLILNSVLPHPHLGMSGSLFALGCGILDRDSKLLLHRDIRPTVDTPLCAGCGSCLATCIFDAITIKSGRAFIDHKHCTGCGECMTACHLAGISPEDATRVPRFQSQVAEAGYAVARQSKAGENDSILYANILTTISRQDAGGFGRDRLRKPPKGVLLSADPVALDQATWDLLVKGSVHGLRQWSGFLVEPGPLMDRAEALGLGCRQYNLQIRT